MTTLDYLVNVDGNEELLEKFLFAILEGACLSDKDSFCSLQLQSGEKFLVDSVVQYFFNTRPLQQDEYIQFFEKLRLCCEAGFSDYSYSLGKWIDQVLRQNYFEDSEDEDDWGYPQEKSLKPNIILTEKDQQFLTFLCYVAICHMKYDASFASVTAHQYFDIAQQLGSTRFEQIQRYGSQQLDIELTQYQDENITCQANDAFATIQITTKNDQLDTYRRILFFINQLLKNDFPKSFSIEFNSPHLKTLAIENLPVCGQYYLFAGAIQYPALYPDILEYISLTQQQYHWYSNLEDEDCALPGTFAVFALGLVGAEYFDVLKQYLKVVDDGHQSLQQHFTPVFLMRYGVDENSLPILISLILSMQEHPPHAEFLSYFQNIEALKLLLLEKQKLADDYRWSYVLYTLFDHDYESELMQQHFSKEQWDIYQQLLAAA